MLGNLLDCSFPERYRKVPKIQLDKVKGTVSTQLSLCSAVFGGKVRNLALYLTILSAGGLIKLN